MGMTIDEAIKYLRALKRCETCEEGDIGRCKSCSCYRIGSSAKCYDAIDVGVDTMRKYQEQQRFLDKIRAEIDSHCSYNRDRNDGLYIAMKIIDKYKAESEGNNVQTM